MQIIILLIAGVLTFGLPGYFAKFYHSYTKKCQFRTPG